MDINNSDCGNSQQGDTLKQNPLNSSCEGVYNCSYDFLNCSQDPDLPPTPSNDIIQAWTWGDAPNRQGLQDCLNSLVREQWELCESAAGSTLSSLRLSQRLVLTQRYLTALKRSTSPVHQPEPKPVTQIQRRPDNENMSGREQRATLGLARVGSRAALSFAFAFCRRSWRSGEDQDLCSELLAESLEAMRSLPEASLYQTDSVSNICIEVVERADKFLKQVVSGEVSGRGGPLPPLEDRHIALALLLELDIQKASLSCLLSNVMLLLNLWNNNTTRSQNQRNVTSSKSAPLLPVLKRLRDIPTAASAQEQQQDQCLDETERFEPCQSFLDYLEYPTDNERNIDLKLSAVTLMCELDRLARPLVPPNPAAMPLTTSTSSTEHSQVSGGKQEVGFWGFGRCETVLEGLGIVSVVSVDKYIYVVTGEGKLIRVSVNGSDKEVETVDTKLLEERDSKPVKIAAAGDGKHFLLLTENGEVWSWGLGDGGRLGHGDQTSLPSPHLLQDLVGKTIVKISAGSTYSAAITQEGQLYTWGKGNYGRLGHGTVEDCLVPTLVSALNSYKVIDVACGTGDAQTLCVTREGVVYSWGDGDYGKLGRGGSDGSGIPRSGLLLGRRGLRQAGSRRQRWIR